MGRRLAALAALALATSALLCACKKDPPSRWDQAASAAQAPAAAPEAPPKKEGAAFNTFFPPDGADGAKRVFTQEKDGFAEAKLQRDGKDVATLSISDASSDPAVKSKFASAAGTVQGHPLVTVGKNQSALLVKDKYQVKVSSQTLDEAARKVWLERFNLGGLAAL